MQQNEEYVTGENVSAVPVVEQPEIKVVEERPKAEVVVEQPETEVAVAEPAAETEAITAVPEVSCADEYLSVENHPADVFARYINREKSWLKFNERVLEEAEDHTNPLLERIKFVAIFASNLDEFFMVRVGSLFDEMSLDEEFIDKKTGMNAQQQLDMIFHEVCKLSQRVGDAYEAIISELEQYQYYQVDFDTAEPWLQKKIDAYFQAELAPLLSPLLINARHPFPFLNNKEMYIGVLLKNTEEHMGIVPVSPQFPRKLTFHSPDKEKHYFILLEDVIAHYMPQIFNDTVEESFVFRVTRNGDLDMDEGLYDEDIDWRSVMEQLLKRRNKQAAVRLQFSRPVRTEIWQYLCNKLQLTEREVIIEQTPLDLSFCFGNFDGLEEQAELYYEPEHTVEVPGISRRRSMLRQIEEIGDLLLAYPYHSMLPFIDLLEQAATDPDVISVKITLYRLASNSRIVNALVRAAENGKDVLVLVELRARFDEQHNIDCSKKLEEAGCTVIYGVEHYKVHSKLMVMTYRSENKIRYITQIGTGNYNEKTARMYTDLSLITPNEDIGREAVEVFQALALGQFVKHSRYLLVAPEQMKKPLMNLIDEEIIYAQTGEKAQVIIKTNSLSHKEMIDKLIEASQAGVEVTLLVRGICCLQAGIPGISDHITVKSIVGRHLEHSRIFSFGVGKRQRMFIGSADWMTRNMDYRVEVAVEVLDDKVKKTLNQMLELYLSDNRKLRTMDVNGNYLKTQRAADAPVIDSQMELFDYFAAKAQKARKKQQKKEAETKKNTTAKKDKNKGKQQKKKDSGNQMKLRYGFLKKKDRKNKK